jgi:hypothetical protein
MPTYKGPYSGDDKECNTGVGLDRDSYNPGSTPNEYVSNAKGTNKIDLSYIDRDNSVGSGPVDDGRDVSHKPRKMD